LLATTDLGKSTNSRSASSFSPWKTIHKSTFKYLNNWNQQDPGLRHWKVQRPETLHPINPNTTKG
jgi:hypothetical protein